MLTIFNDVPFSFPEIKDLGRFNILNKAEPHSRLRFLLEPIRSVILIQ